MCFVRSENQQRLLPYRTLGDWFCITRLRVYTARHAMGPNVKRKRLVFKWLILLTLVSFVKIDAREEVFLLCTWMIVHAHV
jgi:hypothetical protein